MRAVFGQASTVFIVVFAVSSMLSVGLAYGIGLIVGPLREARAVFRALVANFVLVPLLAVGIEQVIPLDPPFALGLFLLAGSAGAPFLIKLVSAAKSDLALSAALLVLLVPATVVFLPFYVPLAMAHPTLRSLTYEPSSIFAIGLPLLSTLLLPIVVGLAVGVTLILLAFLSHAPRDLVLLRSRLRSWPVASNAAFRALARGTVGLLAGSPLTQGPGPAFRDLWRKEVTRMAA